MALGKPRSYISYKQEYGIDYLGTDDIAKEISKTQKAM
jgi:hypothetical protein